MDFTRFRDSRRDPGSSSESAKKIDVGRTEAEQSNKEIAGTITRVHDLGNDVSVTSQTNAEAENYKPPEPSQETKDHVLAESQWKAIEGYNPYINCHGETFLRKKAWLYEPRKKVGDHKDHPVEKILSSRFRRLDLSRDAIQEGDVAIFRDTLTQRILHSAPVISVEGQAITLYSRLGTMGSFEHDLSNEHMKEVTGGETVEVYHTDHPNGRFIDA